MATKNARALLRIESPDGTEWSVPVTDTPFNLGRVSGNHLQLPEKKVSRHHARLLLEGEQFHLVDLNSTNGTMVGETKLRPNEPYELAYEEKFQLGTFTLHLAVMPMPASAEAPLPAPRLKEVLVDTPSPPAEPETVRVAQLGSTAAPPPPRRPPEPPPAGEAHEPSYEEAFGLFPEQSRYLEYLPPVYHEDRFLGRFLLAFEGVLAPIEQTVDNFDLYLDPCTTPTYFLDQLAGWLGLSLDEKWPEEKRRAVVMEGAELYRRRGTRVGLSRHLEIYSEVTPEIMESADRPHHFHVLLRIPAGQAVDRATVQRIIRANKPAHTTFTLEILQEK